MASLKKKDGGPNIKFFESAEILAALEPVKQWVIKNCKKVSEYDHFKLYHEYLLLSLKLF